MFPIGSRSSVPERWNRGSLTGVLLLVGLFGLAMSVEGQGVGRGGGSVYPETSGAAESLLLNAEFHIRDEQWDAVVELYQRVIQRHGDAVALLPPDDPDQPDQGSQLFVNVREYCQRRLAQLPAEALKAYRNRVDGEAEHWYRRGVAERNSAWLRRVVDNAFCSSWGDEAIEMLGDLAFQEGRFIEALTAYRRLVPEQSGAAGGFVYPDPSVDLARVAAKKLLCRAALGDDPPVEADLEAFEEAYPDAAGALAGREGPLLQTIAEALEEDGLAMPPEIDGRWPTFAGAPTRTKVARESIDVGSIQWSYPLDQAESDVSSQLEASPFPNRRRGGLGFPTVQRGREPTGPTMHPIVLGDQVLISDDSRILAFDLNARPQDPDGEIEPSWVGGDPAHATSPRAQMPVGTPRYTLTAAGDRIFARLGSFGVSFQGRNNFSPVAPPSTIVAVQRSTQGKFLWKRSSDEIALPNQGERDQGGAGFGGTPVADEKYVYAAMLQPGPRSMTWVVCLDAETGRTRWVRYVCSSSSMAVENFQAGGFNRGGLIFNPDLGHRLLTLHGSTLYYQTDMGALAALDAETGRLRWLATYPRRDQANINRSQDRDLNPAVVQGDRVMIAPKDSNAIFAFDADSGRLAWKVEPQGNVAHLLGVAKDRLVATGNYVWTIDIATGEIRSQWPDGLASEEGHGRGALAADEIYWPTQDKIYILDQATGLPTNRPPILLSERFQEGGGNLVVGDGYLVVAQTDRLVVFCQNTRLIQRYRDLIAENPEDASNYFRLAQLAEATGDDRLALESLDQAVAKARSTERINGRRLIDAVETDRYRLLLKLGRQAERAEQWVSAAESFAAAAETAGADQDRLNARLQQAHCQAQAGQSAQAVATLQRLLIDDRFRALSVPADPHRTIRADLLVTTRLRSLLDQHGRDLYEAFEADASELLRQGERFQDEHLLREVFQSYPVARAAPKALLALADLFEAQGQPAEAARVYRQLVATTTEDSQRARGLLGLARAYEDQEFWGPAWDVYNQVLTRYREVRLDVPGIESPLGIYVESLLNQEPLASLATERFRPEVPMPLVRGWERRWSGTARPIMAEGVLPTPDAGRIFLAEGTTLRPVDPRSGASPWTVELDDEPLWVGYLADRVVAATQQKLAAFSLDEGKLAWEFRRDQPRPGRPVPDPFAKPDADAADNGQDPNDNGFFHRVRIVGDRIFCQQGKAELLAFEGDRGLPEWSFRTVADRLNPSLWIGPERIVLQTRAPNTIQVLETNTGRRLAEFAQADSAGAWPRAPLPVADDRVAVVLDPKTIGLFDHRRGEFIWEYREETSLPRYDPPRLLGDAECLIVLTIDGLIRLDPFNGEVLWTTPLQRAKLTERPQAFALDDDHFYWIGHSEHEFSLNALALESGQEVWHRRLTTGSTPTWGLALARNGVLAFPTPPAQGDQGRATNLPLVFCRRETGELVQRIVLSTSGSDLAVRLSARGVVIATQEGLWGLDTSLAMDAQDVRR